MDSLNLYKGKLNDALALVPSMSHENKRQAVDFWNVVARQLEVIVHDDETRSSYGYHSTLNSPELHQAAGQLSPEFNLADAILHETKENVTTIAPTIVPNNPIITSASSTEGLAANGITATAFANLSTCSLSNSISTSATSHLVAPTFKQTSVSQFQQENLLNKTVFDTTYLDRLTDQVVEEGAILASPAAFNNKMSAVSPLDGIHLVANYNSSSQDDGICTGLSVDGSFHEGDQILGAPTADSTPFNYTDVFKHHNHHHHHHHHDHSTNGQQDITERIFVSGLATANATTTSVATTTQVQQLAHIKLDGCADGQPTCEICGKSGFSTKGNLKRHLRSHSGEKPYKCEFCESRFTEKKSLKIHMRRHTGEKPYKCQVCGKLFSQTGVLQSHMALHLNERKFDCPKCAKAFRQRSQLKLHIMRHDGVKRLECSTCRARFLTKGDLERHCRTHTGERPYACQMCPKTFTRQQSLNEHVNRHTGRRPYDCKYCDKTFSEMSACYKHAKTHRKEEQQTQQLEAIAS